MVRPGRLTDDAGTARIQVGELEGGEIPRADVAAVLAGCLDSPATVGRTFDVVAGDVPVDEALTAL